MALNLNKKHTFYKKNNSKFEKSDFLNKLT